MINVKGWGTLWVIPWIAGFVIAKGFWSTLACLFAPWSYYLVAELLMTHFGLI